MNLISAYRASRERRQNEALFKKAVSEGVVPPQYLWAMVGADHSFVEQGEAVLQMLIETVDLTPYSIVLDIGCGLGKLAGPIAMYLQPPGSYDGFDIEPLSIRWCKEAITARYSHARFQLLPIQSKMYNPAGASAAEAVTFPYGSARFDIVFLGSVFTHMFRAEVERYIDEIARVLKPGGFCLASFYLLNDQRRASIKAGTANFTFAHNHRGSWIEVVDPPEGAVAQDESWVLMKLKQTGLEIQSPLRYGSWAEKKSHDQDIVIVRRSEMLSDFNVHA